MRLTSSGDAFIGLAVGEDERLHRASASVAIHHVEIGIDIGARSILLMMRISDWLIQDRSCVGILSPAATSIHR